MDYSLENLTWTCHICKRSRPDAKISAKSRDTSLEHGFDRVGIMQMNVRYCNDNPDCERKAENFDHLK